MSIVGTVSLLDNRYRLDEQIASGNFSDIWRGTDMVLARPVAVKLLRADSAADAQGLVRFRAAARHAGLLAHENIARVYDYDEPGGPRPPFLVMEFVDGPSLAEVLASGPLEPARVMHLVAQSAAGLFAAHRAGLVHSDIRPGTLLLRRGDVIKVTNFGLPDAAEPELTSTQGTVAEDTVTQGTVAEDTVAQDTVAQDMISPDMTSLDPVAPDRVAPDPGDRGAVLGSPDYLAPERLAGGGATPASDLYSLGIVAYLCLAGSIPARGNAGDAPLPPLPETVPAAVAVLVSELTDLDPAGRPGSAAEVARRAGELRDELIPEAADARAGYSTLLAAAQGVRLPRPRRTGGSPDSRAAPGGPGAPRRPRGGPRPLHRPLLLGGAAIAAVVIALVVTGVIGFGARGPAVPSNAARLAGKTKMVQVNGAALRGQPVSVVQGKLRQLGLVVRVRWQASDQLAPGLVLSVRPDGRVPTGSVVVVLGALQAAGAGHSPGSQGGAAPGHTKPPGSGRSQPPTSPTAAVSATATGSPSPTTSPSATASPTASPTGTASPTAPASPPVTSIPSSPATN